MGSIKHDNIHDIPTQYLVIHFTHIYPLIMEIN